MTQRYQNRLALDRMSRLCCPECGEPVGSHGGRGSPRCSLTDNGVVDRIAAYHAELTQREGDQP